MTQASVRHAGRPQIVSWDLQCADPARFNSPCSAPAARRTGRLSAEERAARLAEMAGNADVHEEARWSRLRNAKATDDAEEAAAAAGAQARRPARLKRIPGLCHKRAGQLTLSRPLTLEQAL